MRISIYKGEQGNMSALVEPSPGKRLVPVMVPAVTPGSLTERIMPIIREMRAAPFPRGPGPG